jgi:hypothetical protein
MPEGQVDGAVNQPAGGDTGGQQTSTTQQPSGQQGQPQQTSQSSAQRQDPAPGQNGGNDARDRGILADLQRERTNRQNLEARIRELEGGISERDRRVAALAGIQVPSAEDAEVEQIRAQFARVFPGLAKLTDDQIETILSNAGTAQTLQQTVAHHWENHGRSMLEGLESEVADTIGGTLSDRQKRALATAYIAAAEADPEFLKRHNRGDKALLKEFAKDWLDDWYEPARRSVTAQNVNHGRPVPRGRERTVTTTPAKPINFKDPKSVEDAMVESFRSHGGTFTG